ncbi:MAG: sensor histidine kinase [Galactobacter sp.]|uniref:sensor histidine kinase n=1 Tax=Galactobacter sp. TaxID=2676125 RepID=UPI0025BF03B4|nr:HAMP domain-containing sensor histidine kinase [Galactobacter sp.]
MTERRRHPSARLRIVGAIVGLMTVFLGLADGITGRILFDRVQEEAQAESAHELDKFRQAASSRVSGNTAQPSSLHALFADYLRHHLTDSSEQLFSVVDGKADLRSRTEDWTRLDTNEVLVKKASAATKPIDGRMQTTDGEVFYAILPVSLAGQDSSGALVVIEYLEPGYQRSRDLVLVMIVAGLIALVVTAIGGWLVAGHVLAPVRRVRDTAELISETDLSKRIEVTGNDDVAQLTRTFNGMLDRLETAFESQRRFLDDAGHELRTPVTIVRGHLSVMGESPEEQAQTLKIVEDELNRMSRLIDDLIMLARSERPGFVDLAPTELTDLVVETLAKATSLGDRDWSIDALPEGTAYLDQNRITQALLQLASNAVRYSSTGDAISIGGAIHDDGLQLWVADSGIGIAEEDQSGIFQRFTRGARTGNTPGRGLGLAIVSRIAQAHGGTVSVESALGEGSVFTLDLPLRTEAPRG